MIESPSLLLQRAAERLDDLARAAALPPWTVGPYVDLEYYRRIGLWQVTGPNWEVGESDATPPMTEGDANWIGAMSPAVAQPLANILRDAAFTLDAHPEYRNHYLSYVALAEAVLGVPLAEDKERSDP